MFMILSKIARSIPKLFCLLVMVLWTSSVKADLITGTVNWVGIPSSWQWQWNGITYVASSTSEPAFVVDIASGINTWVFSSKGSSGDFLPVIIFKQTSTSAASYAQFTAYHKFMGAGVNPLIWWTDLRAFSGYYLVTIIFAHPSGGAAPSRVLHAIGSTVAYNIIKSADNDPTNRTTFYVGSADSGISGFVQKCNNGTWVQMGFGVDCNTCLGPYVDSLSVSGNGSVVTVQGNFEMGYNATSPFEVDCTTWGLIYWHNDSSTTGHWSTSP